MSELVNVYYNDNNSISLLTNFIIKSFAISGTKIVNGSSDQTIKIWNITL
jgi:hypothetical protein